jgi:hypothetical protein
VHSLEGSEDGEEEERPEAVAAPKASSLRDPEILQRRPPEREAAALTAAVVVAVAAAVAEDADVDEDAGEDVDRSVGMDVDTNGEEDAEDRRNGASSRRTPNALAAPAARMAGSTS